MSEHDEALPETHPYPSVIAAVMPHERALATRLGDATVRFVAVGGIAGAALALSDSLGVPAWTLFLTWTSYGLLGGRVRDGLRLLAGFNVGLIAGSLTVLAGTSAVPVLGQAAMPIALGIACGLLAALDQVPPINLVPAYFVGMVSYFAAGPWPSVQATFGLAVAAALGIGVGWLSNRAINFGDQLTRRPG